MSTEKRTPRDRSLALSKDEVQVMIADQLERIGNALEAMNARNEDLDRKYDEERLADEADRDELKAHRERLSKQMEEVSKTVASLVGQVEVLKGAAPKGQPS